MEIMRPKVFGLTGNMGCGKSTVAQMLKEHPDVVVLYSDPLAKWLLSQETGRKKLKQIFGETIFSGENILWKKIAEIIFSDHERKKELEDFINPLTLKEIERQIADVSEEKNVIVESALIYEVEWDNFFDGIIVAVCETREQLRRLSQRGMSLMEIKERLIFQLPQEEKIKRANFVINTTCTLNELRVRVTKLYDQLKME